MPGPTSNIDEVVRWLGGFIDSFDFTRPGIDQSLGRDTANAVCQGIADRSRNLRKGADTNWPDLSNRPFRGRPGYRDWKHLKYGINNEPLSRTGQMLSMTSLRGGTEYAPTEIRVIYGTGQPPKTSAAPTGLLSDADRKVTDTQKATWATEGSASRPKRPFFELDQTISEGVFFVVEQNLIDYVLSA